VYGGAAPRCMDGHAEGSGFEVQVAPVVHGACIDVNDRESEGRAGQSKSWQLGTLTARALTALMLFILSGDIAHKRPSGGHVWHSYVTE
jgi:hypothetical protein